MSPPRIIRPAVRRPRAGARSIAWPAAAAALPAVVTALVLAAVTMAVLLFGTHGFGDLASVVAVEWLVVVHSPLAVDAVPIGFLPLLLPILYGLVLARQVATSIRDSDDDSWRPVATAVAGAVAGTLAVTGLAMVVLTSSRSDFAVRVPDTGRGLAWALAVAVGAGLLGAWWQRRRVLRSVVPLWSVAGVHLGLGALATTWALGALLVLLTTAMSSTPVTEAFAIGKGFWGGLALAGISVGYLPNVVASAATVALGGEAHLGEAAYSLFATAPGPLPAVPLAAALPTTDPHAAAQLLLAVPAIAAALLARATAHWFDSIGQGVRAMVTAGVVAAVGTAAASPVAGGTIGALGSVGTGALVAAGLAFLHVGIIGGITSALSLAGLTRRREKEARRLERRRAAVAARRSPAVPPPAVAATREETADESVPDESVPDATTPDATTPDEAVSEATTPVETGHEASDSVQPDRPTTESPLADDRAERGGDGGAGGDGAPAPGH